MNPLINPHIYEITTFLKTNFYPKWDQLIVKKQQIVRRWLYYVEVCKFWMWEIDKFDGQWLWTLYTKIGKIPWKIEFGRFRQTFLMMVLREQDLHLRMQMVFTTPLIAEWVFDYRLVYLLRISKVVFLDIFVLLFI